MPFWELVGSTRILFFPLLLQCAFSQPVRQVRDISFTDFHEVGKLSMSSRPLVMLAGVPWHVNFQILASGTNGRTLVVKVIDDGSSGSGNIGSGTEMGLGTERQDAGKLIGQMELVSNSDLFQADDMVEILVESVGLHKMRVKLLDGYNGTTLSEIRLDDLYAIPGFLCLLPSVVIVIVAIWSRNVLLALFSGLFLGAFFVSNYNPFSAFLRVGDTFMYKALQESDMGMLLFTWFMSGLVGIIGRSGGSLGLGRSFARYATTPDRCQMLACAAGLLIFFDDYASILILGPTMRPLTDSCGVSREKLAFLVDSTAAPVAAVSGMSTWIGFELSVIQQQLDALRVSEDALSVFLRALPTCHYPFLVVILAVLVSATGRDFGPMLAAERRAHRAAAAAGRDAMPLTDLEDPRPEPDDDRLPADPDTSGTDDDGVVVVAGAGGGASAEAAVAAPPAGDPELEPDLSKPVRAINGLLPILVMLTVMISGILYTGSAGYYASAAAAGGGAGGDGNGGGGEGSAGAAGGDDTAASAAAAGVRSPTVLEMVTHAEMTKVLIWASLLGDAVAAGLAWGQGVLTVEQCTSAWIAGIRAVTVGLLTLILAWSVGTMSKSLHVGAYVAAAIGPWMPAAALPPAALALSAFISVASGSSWGAMVIMLPIVMPLAAAAAGGREFAGGGGGGGAGASGAGPGLVAGVAAVISGSLFGDHCSPISDTTVLAALASSCDVMDHARTQAPYAAAAFLVSMALTCLAAAGVAPPAAAGLQLPLGGAALWIMLMVGGTRARGEPGGAGPGPGGCGRWWRAPPPRRSWWCWWLPAWAHGAAGVRRGWWGGAGGNEIVELRGGAGGGDAGGECGDVEEEDGDVIEGTPLGAGAGGDDARAVELQTLLASARGLGASVGEGGGSAGGSTPSPASSARHS